MGSCAGTCAAGFGDCNGNLRSDGCESFLPTFYRDLDNDGFGSAANGTVRACAVPGGYRATNTDCNDSSNAVYPGAVELCNSIDDNCDGTVDNRPIANDCPSRPSDVTLAVGGGQVTITGNNTGATTDQSACVGSSYDVFYRFTLSAREMVYVDTFGTGYDSVVSILNSGLGAITCNDDSCGTLQSQTVAVLDAGTYYIRYAGYGSASGAFTLHVQHIPASNSVFNFNAGSTTYSGNTSTAVDRAGPSGLCYNNGGRDNTYYWMTCPTYGGGTVSAQTCSRASWDTVLRYIDGRVGTNLCYDDQCGLQSRFSTAASAGAGVRAMYVDGFSSGNFGAYSVLASRP